MSFVPLVAPTTANSRLQKINESASSFIYVVSVLGVTGSRNELSPELPSFVKRVKEHVDFPIAIGFGVSNRSLFDQVAKLSEGVVVGSSIIKTVANVEQPQRAEALKKFSLSLTENATSPYWEQYAELTKITEKPEPELEHLPATFGSFGGCYASESLMGALSELEAAYVKIKNDPNFQQEYIDYLKDYVGRPSRLYRADRMSDELGGASIWFKREDLNHTGAHKINNAIGQALLAKRLGKKRIIAETGAGQHGVATATVCAKMGLECIVYMGAEDVQRQSLNVFKMKLLGAKVVAVSSGSKTLKDAINEAMRDWVTNVQTTHYLVGSAIGPHPFPTIVRDFQAIIGKEARSQFQERAGKLPDLVMACVGGGSNAIGMFHPFVNDKSVKILGVEAAGHGVEQASKHCATMSVGTIGVLHGTKTLLLQDKDGQASDTHSISAGLDYPGVGPEHAWLKESGRAEYRSVDDQKALEGFTMITKLEGIIPALETSHVIYEAIQQAKKMSKDQNILVCLSGRGDKDMGTVAKAFDVNL